MLFESNPEKQNTPFENAEMTVLKQLALVQIGLPFLVKKTSQGAHMSPSPSSTQPHTDGTAVPYIHFIQHGCCNTRK